MFHFLVESMNFNNEWVFNKRCFLSANAMTPVTLRSFSTPFSPLQVAGQISYMPDSQLSVALLLILGMTPDESEKVAR